VGEERRERTTFFKRGPFLLLAAALAAAALAAYFARDRDGLISDLDAALAAVEPRTADAEARTRELRVHLERQPRDARGWVIYARQLADRDRFAEAAEAYERALALSFRVARDPEVWCEFADALGMARGGKLAGRPRELIDRALALDPEHPKALEMAGSAEYEQGRYAAAADTWRRLLARLRPGSQRHDEVAAAIARAERLAAGEPRR